jgi:hypothetical protein
LSLGIGNITLTEADIDIHSEPSEIVRRFIAEMLACELQKAAAYLASTPED